MCNCPFILGFCFILGEKQAALLCKSQFCFELPKRINQLVGFTEIKDQDSLVQNIILQAIKWDPTWEKLPKVIDRARPHIVFKRVWGIPDKRKG